MIEISNQKFQPGQKVKVVGNKDALGFTYHLFPINETVNVIRHRPERGKYFLCKNDKGLKQTLYETDLEPLPLTIAL
jgi:hypothetical protein